MIRSDPLSAVKVGDVAVSVEVQYEFILRASCDPYNILDSAELLRYFEACQANGNLN